MSKGTKIKGRGTVVRTGSSPVGSFGEVPYVVISIQGREMYKKGRYPRLEL